MNKLLISLFLLSTFLNSPAAPPPPPLLTLAQHGSETVAQWTAVENATGYTLLYAPYPEGTPIESIDMGINTALKVTLPPTASYYVAIKAYNAEGGSDYSNIDFFTLSPQTLIPHAPLLDDRMGNWPNGGIRNEFSQIAGAHSIGETGGLRDYLQVSPCQTVGLVYREVTTTDSSYYQTVIFYEVTPENQATKTTLFTREGATLPQWSFAYDHSCTPHLFYLEGGQYQHSQRKGQQWVVHPLPLANNLGTEIREIEHGVALLGQDQRVHLLFNATVDGNPRFINAVLLSNDWQGGNWQIYSHPPILTEDTFGNQVLDYAVDQQGRIHLVYGQQEAGVKRNLHYAYWDQDQWQIEVVLLGEDILGQGFTTVSRNASLALDRQGQVAIASTFIRHVDTGSYQYAHLLYHTRTNGQWRNQTVVQNSAGYAGTDGTQFTGMNPQLIFDQNNLPHIVFSDIASWHNNLGHNEDAVGQLRHAALTSAGTWQLETLITQPGQAVSSNPLQGLMYPAIATAVAGKRLAFAGV